MSADTQCSVENLASDVLLLTAVKPKSLDEHEMGLEAQRKAPILTWSP